MVFDLASEERELLLGLVRERMRAILPEIRRSDHRAFRDQLKHEHALLERCLQHLSSAGPEEPAPPVADSRR